MRRKTSIILTALIMACSVTACQGAVSSVTKNVIEKNAADQNKETAQPEESETPVSTETELSSDEQEEQEQELYNSYIEVNNFMLGRVSDSLERYFNYVDIEQEEFALLDPDYDYFDCYSLSEYNIEEVENTYALASGKSDKSALDEAYLEMYPSLSLVISTLNDIETYTEMKSYLDDDYQKAKEFHETLMGALVEYVDAGDQFMAELDIVASENVDALIAYDGDEEKLAAEGISKYGWWDSFMRDLKDTKVSLTEVLQKVKNGEELSQFDMNSHFSGDCSLSSFDAGLSSLINDYNNIIDMG